MRYTNIPELNINHLKHVKMALDNISNDAETIIEHIKDKMQMHKLNVNSKIANKSMIQYNQTAVEVLKNLLLDIQELT